MVEEIHVKEHECQDINERACHFGWIKVSLLFDWEDWTSNYWLKYMITTANQYYYSSIFHLIAFSCFPLCHLACRLLILIRSFVNANKLPWLLKHLWLRIGVVLPLLLWQISLFFRMQGCSMMLMWFRQNGFISQWGGGGRRWAYCQFLSSQQCSTANF